MVPFKFECFTIHVLLLASETKNILSKSKSLNLFQASLQKENVALVWGTCNYTNLKFNKGAPIGSYKIIKQHSKDKRHFTLHFNMVNAIMGELRYHRSHNTTGSVSMF